MLHVFAAPWQKTFMSKQLSLDGKQGASNISKIDKYVEAVFLLTSLT